MLSEVEERVAKAERVLGKLEAKGTGVNTRIVNAKARIVEAKARARVVEKVLSKAKDQTLAIKKEVLASEAVTKVVEAFRARKYHLEVLKASRDAF